MTALTLADFLRARYDEDAADHYPYQPSDDGDFTTPTSGCVHCGIPANTAGDLCRVLADVAVKRRIVDEATNYTPELEHGDNGEWAFDVTLRLLALPYASHPDHRQEWAV